MATRRDKQITITFKSDNTPKQVIAETEIAWADVVSGTIERTYIVDYDSVGSGAQGRVDDFVSDVRAFVASEK